MARIRSVKPEFWTDGDMLCLSLVTRLFYIGLWNFADDNGVIEGNPLSLKAKIFPCDEVDVAKCIKELGDSQKIIAYKNGGGKDWMMIKSFLNHQNPDRPRKSNNPLPNKELLDSIGFQLKSNEISLGEERRGEDRIGIYNVQLFEELWLKYPSKIGKARSIECFRKTVKTAEDEKNIRLALEHYLQSKQVKDGYIQNAKTWFNDWSGWVHMKPDPLEKWRKK